jgi:predicted phosphoribosyltransferase
MRFRDRLDAGEQLAARLARYGANRPLVLGVPRGGVPMAACIADRLSADLDVLLVHKLRAPDQPELAVGSIDEAGRVYLTSTAAALDLDEHALAGEIRHQLNTLRSRRARYSAARPPMALARRTVILVDDGLATGSTMIAAVRAARALGAGRIVVAIGVAPAETLTAVRAEADDVVCVYSPEHFLAVGEFFDDFSQVTDDDVVRVLSQKRADRTTAAARPS